MIAARDPLFVTVIVCCVADASGALAKRSEPGEKWRPGSAMPKPTSEAVTLPAPVATVSVPARVPIAEGANSTGIVQLSPLCSVPPHAVPPVTAVVAAKSPVRAGALVATAAGVAFVSENRSDAVELPTVTGPKSSLTGVSNTPVSARPVPVSASVSLAPPVVALRVSVAI